MSHPPVILITGASGGVGQAAALACARQGARIAIAYQQNRTAAGSLLASLPHGPHSVHQADITQPKQAEALIDAVHTTMGSLDVLVNNAGVSARFDVASMSYADWQSTWQRIMDTNLTAAANLSFCAAQRMMPAGGRIINVSSRGAFRGEPLMPWYGASKAGMNAMGQSLAQALGPHNVFVYTIAPGFIETPMASSVLEGAEGASIRQQSPLGRVAQPEEVAETIRYLALDAPTFMTGSIIDINGASYLRS